MTIEKIDREVCNSCGLCLDSCPCDVIRYDGENKAVIAYPDDCHTCFLCESDCPVAAITVAPEVPYIIPFPY